MSIPEQYFKAGKIAAEVKPIIKETVHPGISALEICDVIKDTVMRKGGSLAFPTGIGINAIAAHYAPQDKATVITAKDVVKIDFGVHIEGYLVDTALTVSFNPEYQTLIRATEQALDAAIEFVKTEKSIRLLGSAIEAAILKSGFKPVSDLAGHNITRYNVHGGKTIPNVNDLGHSHGGMSLVPGDVFAIEPFLTPLRGTGHVRASQPVTILALNKLEKTGDTTLDEFTRKIWDERKTLPFTLQWYHNDYPDKQKLYSIVNNLIVKELITPYPTLVETGMAPVSQFENTMVLDGPELVVLT
jgi:methionyl aminopeptidase